MKMSKNDSRLSRKVRIRRKVNGTAARPRLVVFRSNVHIYAQIVDDEAGKTLVSASTLVLSKNGEALRCNKAGAESVGKDTGIQVDTLLGCHADEEVGMLCSGFLQGPDTGG